MYQLIRKILFLLPAEKAHELTTSILRVLTWIPGFSALTQSIFRLNHPRLEKSALGLTFPNQVGLAAGFDKNATWLHQFRLFGFGFIEIGTITPLAQPGNPKPRLFRLPKDEALINRMGFNNLGIQEAIEKLKNRPDHLIVGGNIGKNKITPNEKAVNDYLKCFEGLFDHVDYFVVNVSSPNTPNLRELQDRKPLTNILQSLQDANQKKQEPKPILLKIAPDLTHEQLDEILEIIRETNTAGIIATNTTIGRDNLVTGNNTLDEIGAGGLSGKPLTARSTQIIKYLHKKDPDLFIIGVGGIMNENDAIEKLDAGAQLIQLYTGFIYEGPGLVKRIKRAILNYIDRG